MGGGRRFLEMVGAQVPVVQAPMNGVQDAALCIAVSRAGALGSLPTAGWSVARCREEIAKVRGALGVEKKFNANFFCHEAPSLGAYENSESRKRWEARIEAAASSVGVISPLKSAAPGVARHAFGEEATQMLEELRPGVASFHFGLPKSDLLQRVKNAGTTILATATTVEEAVWLEENGVDVIIAQGVEAGGHQGGFLNPDSNDVSEHFGLLALVPLIADAVKCPVVAAGGIADGRGLAAALALGAEAAQIGTAFMRCPEATTPGFHKTWLDNASSANATVLTNVFSGRPARGLRNLAVDSLGPINPDAPPFPAAGPTLAGLQAVFDRDPAHVTNLWAGQAFPLGPTTDQATPAAHLVRRIVSDARRVLDDTTVIGPPP